MSDVIPGTDIPKPEVQLTGADGNALSVIGNVQGALRRAGASDETISAFVEKATSGDYNNVLQTAMEYADVS